MEDQNLNKTHQRLKIICVRPLKNCNHHILKNLIPDVPYMFYNNYEFKDNSVVKISEDTVPSDFYSNNITIHAIVGMNGCGKSTIIEILLRLINNLAFQFIGKLNHPSADDLGYVKGIVAEFYYEKEKKIFIVKQTDNDNIEWLDENNESMIHADNKFILEQLFYTLVVNYSHYAYNEIDYQREIYKSKSPNCWIKSIFHKNDGYETPIVLNPYREDGDIKINRENDLSTARLTSLFVKTEIEGRQFHNLYNLAAFDLKINNKKVEEKYNKAKEYWKEIGGFFSTDFSDVNNIILKCWSETAFPIIRNINNNDVLTELSRKYLVYKTIAVIYKYTIFKEYYLKLVEKSLLNNNALINIFSSVIKRLNEDNSHITLKIRQTLLFITLQQYNEVRNLETKKILEIITKHSGGDFNLDSIMNLLPPPIFETKIKLKYITEKKRIARIELTNLSSGERQQLYSRSSLLYHLVNLDSIKDKDRIKYNNIEVILEEVELYYHPEYQREYVQSLIDSIGMLQLNPEKHIDICIVTHSPLILSDIPLENILFLDDGKPKVLESNINTFGSNIYDLLRYNFFLDKSAFGEFASLKMNLLIKELKKTNVSRETKQKAKEVIALIGDDFVAKILTDYLD